MKKKVISFIFSVLVLLGQLLNVLFDATTAYAASSDEILAQMNRVYDTLRAKKDGDMTAYKNWCGAYVCDQLVALGILSDGEFSGHGKNWYSGLAAKNVTTTGYQTTAFSGKNCINDICATYGDAYNIVVGFSKGAGTDGQTYGHVLFIHAIIDGTVYWSESWQGKDGLVTCPIGKPVIYSVAEFYHVYRNYVFDGAVMLSKDGGIEQIKKEPSITISGEAVPPATLDLGERFFLKGVISSVFPIAQITAGIYEIDTGKVTSEYIEVSPNTTSFDIANVIDPAIKFNELPRGRYTFILSVRDSTGFEESKLLYAPFTVGKIDDVQILTITFNANGGKPSAAAYSTTTDGMIYDLNANTVFTKKWESNKGDDTGLRDVFLLERDHYTFVGWSLSKDGSSAIFSPNDTSLTTNSILPDMQTSAALTLFAVWEHCPEKGDLNKDGQITFTDADLLMKFLTGETTVLNDSAFGDMNDDGVLNALDLTLLKRRILINESIVITLNKRSLMLNTEGASKNFQLSTTYINPDDVVWKSSNPSIVTVSTNGLLTALKDGQAKVTATVNGETLAADVVVKTAFEESWSKKSAWGRTPIESSDTRRVYTEERTETIDISVNLAYACARTKGDHIRQFYKDPVDVAALGLDTGYGLNTTLNVFGVPYITKTLEELEQATVIPNNERSSGDQWGYNRSGQKGYCFDNACIWFEVGRNQETVTETYYCYEDLIRTPVVYDN